MATGKSSKQETYLSGMVSVKHAQVKESDVKQIGGKAGGISAEELFGTGFTYRHDWGDLNHQHILNLSWGAINHNSRVFVAIGEGAANGGKFMGAARFTLYNVAPQDGLISIRIDVDWDSPLRVYVDYLVVNP